MDTDTFFQEIQGAAVIKHGVLRRYLRVFVSKVGSTAPGGRVYYLDGYAGPGRYTDGTPGSPALALQTADQLAGIRDLQGICVETDSTAFAELEALLSGHANWKAVNEPLERCLPRLLATMGNDTPLFAFFDPFQPTHHIQVALEEVDHVDDVTCGDATLLEEIAPEAEQRFPVVPLLSILERGPAPVVREIPHASPASPLRRGLVPDLVDRTSTSRARMGKSAQDSPQTGRPGSPGAHGDPRRWPFALNGSLHVAEWDAPAGRPRELCPTTANPALEIVEDDIEAWDDSRPSRTAGPCQAQGRGTQPGKLPATAGLCQDSAFSADTSRMYRCGHCPCLHFFSAQARSCSETRPEIDEQFLAELIKQSEQGRLPWNFKYAARKALTMTPAEEALRQHLRSVIGFDSFRVEWWLDELDYRVDFLVPAARLVIEVDGPSHRGREGADLVRAIRIRHAGYEVARASNDDVLNHGRHIAIQVANRVGSSLVVTHSQTSDDVA